MITPSRFKRLSKAGKRCAIIRDALKQIEVKAYRVKRGVYSQPSLTRDAGCSINQEVLTQDKPVKCQCCDTGALFLSTVRITNKFDDANVNGDSVVDKLIPYFKPRQLVLIEAAFEQKESPPLYWSGIVGGVVSWEDRARAVTFGAKYKSALARTRAIFGNMLRNKGIFTP